ncbi:MAG: Methyltransferase, FkbM family [Candidatus Kapaibacterium sp.]|nr:MAG: Methyltransferase, FkbM family [Candidatus Kapabacteria bacterium]
MEEFLVTAIVSTYNSEKFIRGRLENLTNQTLFKKNLLEIIVVDAGSQQNEKIVVEEYRNKFPNKIKYIRTPNRIPLYAAWNIGIKNANGKFITNANTDDRHHPMGMEILANELEESPEVDLVYCNYIITEVENQTFENCTPSGYTIYPYFDKQHLLYVTYIGHSPMWRKSLHSKFGYFDESYRVAGDLEWWLRISENCLFKHIPLLLGLYYWNPKGIGNYNSELAANETRKLRFSYQKKFNKLGLQAFYPGIVDFKTFIDFSSVKIQNPEFSFIIFSSHKSDKTLETINSILNQYNKNLEIIFLSTYGNDYLQKFYKFDRRIEFYQVDSNVSLEEAIKFGVSKIKGNYLSIFNDSNKIFPNHLNYLSRLLSDYSNIDILPSAYFYVKQSQSRFYEFSRRICNPFELPSSSVFPINFAHFTFKVNEKINDNLEKVLKNPGEFFETLHTLALKIPTLEYLEYTEILNQYYSI